MSFVQRWSYGMIGTVWRSVRGQELRGSLRQV